MTVNISDANFTLINNVNPGNGGQYFYYNGTVNDSYNVTLNIFGEDNTKYWVFSLGSPNWDNADIIDVAYPGTYEAGAGDDLLYQDLESFTEIVTGPTRLFAGAGDDSISPPQYTNPENYNQVEAYGGAGNDTINGSDSADTLYGDTADSFTGFPTIGGFTAAPYDTAGDGDDVISGYDGKDIISGDGGDDQLDGGNGADTLTGGDGADFLFGGPRGAGDLDILTGGTGPDTFVLSYAQGAADSAGAGFWSGYFEKAAQSIGGSIASSVLKDAVKAAADTGVAVGFLSAGLGAVGGQLVQGFIGLIEDLFASPPPQNPTQDAMVITDFDPREDVLILPLQSTAVETLEVESTTLQQVPGLSGGNPNEQALKFSAGGKVYAYLLPSQDFLTDMGLTGKGDATASILANLTKFSSTIGGTNGSVGFTNLVSPTISQQLPDGGFQPQDTDLPPGSSLLVYGAIGGAVIANGASGTTYGSVLAGTNFADALSTNPKLVDPAQITSFTHTSAFIHGFGGDDLVYGTDQPDRLFGDDGDDRLYAFVSTVNSNTNAVDPESLSGGDGNDILLGGGTAGSFDGGDGSDTFGVLYGQGLARLQLEVDLTTGQAAERAAPSDSSAPVGATAPFPFTVPNTYTLTSIENAIGGPLNDWIRAAPGSVIEGAGAGDYIDATAGGATISYASSTSGVAALLYDDQAVLDGGDAAGDVIAYGDLLTDINGLTGSANADWLGLDLATGDTAAGQPTLTGGAGNDLFRVLGLPENGQSGLFTIADFDQTTGEVDQIDLSPLGVTAITRIVKVQDVYGIVVPPGGNFDLLLTLPNFAGTLSAADFRLANAVSGRAVADPGGEGLVGGRTADLLLGGTGGDHLFGGDGHDVLRGDGGDDALHGGAGRDTLRGGLGADRLIAGSGDDVTHGGAGGDHLKGEDGADRLFGGAGDDSLDGGRGADRMRGGEGADRFQLRFGEADGDEIIDFARGQGDRLSILASTDVIVTAREHGIFLLTDGEAVELVTARGAAVSDFAL